MSMACGGRVETQVAAELTVGERRGQPTKIAGIKSCHGQFERRKYENQKTLSPKNIKVLFGIMDRMEKFKINWFLVYR